MKQLISRALFIATLLTTAYIYCSCTYVVKVNAKCKTPQGVVVWCEDIK